MQCDDILTITILNAKLNITCLNQAKFTIIDFLYRFTEIDIAGQKCNNFYSQQFSYEVITGNALMAGCRGECV